jgi:hypothetical protein
MNIVTMMSARTMRETAKPFLALVPDDGHKQDNEAAPATDAPEIKK